MTRRGILPAILLAAVLADSRAAAPPESSRGAAADEPPVTMEELEVRGYREKPDTLYIAVPEGSRHAAPVRFDLFLEELTRPVAPGEIDGPTKP